MKKRIGTVWVDAGIVMVGDPCYTLPDDATFRDNTARNWDVFVDKLYNPDTNEPFGSGIAVVAQSGYGDGSYPVFVERTNDGRNARLIVEFIPTDAKVQGPRREATLSASEVALASDALRSYADDPRESEEIAEAHEACNDLADKIEGLNEDARPDPMTYWSDHHPLLDDWRYEVANDDTRQGFWEWLEGREGDE